VQVMGGAFGPVLERVSCENSFQPTLFTYSFSAIARACFKAEILA